VRQPTDQLLEGAGMTTLRKRLRSEKGFTLIELLVVMIILAILTAIAIPSYLSFKDRANRAAAGADVRSLIPSIEAYFSDNGTYSGMTVAALQASYDQAINLSTYNFGTGTQTATSYCIQATVPNQTAAKAGPNAQIVITGTCP
jgi:prepilin-type N-terminal cleavage/methylation domain-containing protein